VRNSRPTDFWTTLDTSMPLDMAGTKVAPGYYYLAIARALDGAWSLVVIPAEKVQKAHGDAFLSRQYEGTRIPLTYEKSKDKVAKLHLELKGDEKNLGQCTLTITWGNYKLTAPVIADLKSGAAEAGGKKDKEKGDKGKE